MEIFYKIIFISKLLITLAFILIIFLLFKKYKEYKTFKENEDRTALEETFESPVHKTKNKKET